MLTLKITTHGETSEDLVLALVEVTRLVREGYTGGANRNESGRFHFEIKEVIK